MIKNLIRFVSTVLVFFLNFIAMCFGKDTDLRPAKALWWENETLERVYTLGAKLEQRAFKDKNYIARHEMLRKKIKYFLSLANLKRALEKI